jgi:cell division protein FtsW (lipid II flippase)
MGVNLVFYNALNALPSRAIIFLLRTLLFIPIPLYAVYHLWDEELNIKNFVGTIVVFLCAFASKLAYSNILYQATEDKGTVAPHIVRAFWYLLPVVYYILIARKFDLKPTKKDRTFLIIVGLFLLMIPLSFI